jgi:hypothetical protein
MSAAVKLQGDVSAAELRAMAREGLVRLTPIRLNL